MARRHKNRGKQELTPNNPFSVLNELSPKEKSLLRVLEDPDSTNLTVEQRCEKAQINRNSYYAMMKRSHFIKALRLRHLQESIAVSPLIVRRVHRDAVKGHYMQQKMTLEMSGDYQDKEKPLINIVLNHDQSPQEDIDRELLAKIIEVKPSKEVMENDK